MNASDPVVERIRIDKPVNLDPITVFLEDFGDGRGRAVIVCYATAWSCFWAAMGNRTVREFIAGCDEHYVGGCMTSGARHRVGKDERAYVNSVARAVINVIAGKEQRT